MALSQKPETIRASMAWRRAVLEMWGYFCVFCGHQPVQAAHVINKAMTLGPLRYRSPHFGRPVCPPCHRDLTEHRRDWPEEMRADAVRAHNEIAKQKLEC